MTPPSSRKDTVLDHGRPVTVTKGTSIEHQLGPSVWEGPSTDLVGRTEMWVPEQSTTKTL